MEKYETVINPRGGAVLSHMGYIVMCCRIGYVFFWFSILKEGIIFAHVGVLFQVRSLNCIRSNDSA